MCIQNQQLHITYCGEMTEKDKKNAMELTKQDNEIIDQFRGKLGTNSSKKVKIL